MGNVISLQERRADARIVHDDTLAYAQRGIRRAAEVAKRDLQRGVPTLTPLTILRDIEEQVALARAELRTLRGPGGAA